MLAWGVARQIRDARRGGMRARVPLVALALATSILALALWAPARAHASGCDVWQNTAGGNWGVGANWSTHAPPGEGEEACITEPGTYTVTISAASEKVAALMLGAASGKQTLRVETSCSGDATLSTSAGTKVGADGALTLSNDGSSCGGQKIVTLNGPATNSGTITIESEPGVGGEHRLEGNMTNKGKLIADAYTEVYGSSNTLTNEGELLVEEGQELRIVGGDALDNAAGSITVASGGELLGSGGSTFDQGGGTTSGNVLINEGTLNYTGAGASSITMHNSPNTLSGNLAAGQTLTLEGCDNGSSGSAVATAASSFTNAGAIVLTGTGGCAGSNSEARLEISSGTLTNDGTIEAVPGWTRAIKGNLQNNKTLSLVAGVTLSVSGTYAQSKAATLVTAVSGPATAGALSVGGTATIAGTLSIVQQFKASKGEKFTILSSSALSGKFKKVKGGKIAKTKPKLKYTPVYSTTGVALEVT